MRIEVPINSERLGAVHIFDTVDVYELDSGLEKSVSDVDLGWHQVRHVPFDEINEIERRMAIVVPCKNERLKLLKGVLSGIPHDCLVILVSNSAGVPVDRFEMEREALETFCRLLDRSAIIVHQRDSGLGAAFAEAGMPELVDDEGRVHDGKGEGMMVGVALAKLSGRDIVGFIDADNYVPGAVHEYVKSYAAGFALSPSRHSMVRISWSSKPKIQGSELFFNRWGRTSQVTNRFLNLLLSEITGFGTEIITTGNSGEHAVCLDLALLMNFGSGFSVEPYEYLNLFELFGGLTESPYPEVMRQGVRVYQIETRNPHFHEDKGGDHVKDMRLQALDALYHSPICGPRTREEIGAFLERQGTPARDGVTGVTWYPPLANLDWARFLDRLTSAPTFEQFEFIESAHVVTRAPIALPPEEEEEDDDDEGRRAEARPA